MFLTSIYCKLKRLYENYFTKKTKTTTYNTIIKTQSETSSSDNDYYYNAYPYNNYYNT